MICPICKGSSFSSWVVTGPYTIKTCTGCGLGMTWPFPSTGDLQAANEAAYPLGQRIRTYRSRRAYFEKRYRRYISNIKRYQERGQLLDVGCNIGLFLNVARQEGFTVTGVEVNRSCADYGKKEFDLEIYSDLLQNVSFNNGSFDIITLFDVLEHVSDIHALLMTVNKLLKTGGLLVVQSPNIRSVMAQLTGSKWSWLSPPDHLYHFSVESLTMLLRLHGFEPGQITTWEPAKDFTENLIAAKITYPLLRAFLLNINVVTRCFTLPIAIAQRFWWRLQRGGLIEIYAQKSEGGSR
jgi:SAM-dependent methyltransferase